MLSVSVIGVGVLPAVFTGVLGMSARAAAAIALIVVIRRVLGRRLSPGWRGALWALVAVRLAVPWMPESGASVFAWVERGAAAWREHRAAASEPARPVAATPAALTVTTGLGPAPGRSGDVVVATPVEESETPPAASPLLVWAAGVWGVGVLLLAVRTILSNVRFRRRLRAKAITDPGLRALLDACRGRMGVRRRVRLAESDAVTGPALHGLLHPTILLPPGLIEALSPAELECVVLHELAHARRHDLRAESAVAGLTAVHWFNPLAWAAAACYRPHRELARHAMVIRALARGHRAGAGRVYGHALLRLVEASQRVIVPRPPTLALGLLAGRRALAERIDMIARPGRKSVTVTLIATIVVAGVGCTTMTNPKTPEPPAAGAGQPIEIASDGDTVTRVYDVRDLLVEIPNFSADDDMAFSGERPAGRGATRPTSTAPRLPEVTPERKTKALVALMEETVAPGTWEDEHRAGTLPRPAGAVRELSGQLIVRQTRAAHEQVEKLLARVREVRGLQVTTEARFVLLDPAALAKADGDAAAWLNGPDAASDQRKGLTPRGTYLMPAQMSRLLRAVQAQPSTRMLSTPRITTFNGQRAYVKVASQQAYVADLHVLRNKDGKVAYEPETAVAESGVTFEVQGTVSADRTYVTMEVRPRVSKLMGMRNVAFDGVPADHPAGTPRPTIQQPDLRVIETRATVSVPDGQTLVLGGAEDTAGFAAPDDPGAKPQAGQRLFIFVTPKVVVGRPEEQKSFPLLNGKAE